MGEADPRGDRTVRLTRSGLHDQGPWSTEDQAALSNNCSQRVAGVLDWSMRTHSQDLDHGHNTIGGPLSLVRDTTWDNHLANP